MPPESLLLAVTSGLGVGIFAGIVSGVCYIVVTGYAAKRPRNSGGTRWHCNICGVQFHSIESVLESGRVVTCIKCGANVCRARCCKLLKDLEHQKAGWVCQTCQHPESWFKGILKALQPSSEQSKELKQNMEPAKLEEIDEDLDKLKKNEKQHVRDFIERLVEAMLGSNIDSANVTKMYSDQKYLPILGQSPCSAHASLKLLIRRIIQEAIGLPTLEKNDSEIEMSNGEVGNRTYEDLLATAILNKVVENYQDDLSASRANSVSSRMSNSSYCQNDKEYYFGTGNINSKWRSGANTFAEIDAASICSLDDWGRSDSSAGSTKYVDHMSLTIQQRTEDAPTPADEPKVKPVLQETLVLPENEWQENWVMQKRSFGRNVSPVPVPMLVPDPSSEAKVLIGDREADDTTDLSDADGSDFGDTEPPHGIEHILTSSRKVIGGKNTMCMDEIKENDNFTLNENTHNDVTSGKEDNLYTSFESQTEQDLEYTEKCITPLNTILRTQPANSRNVTTRSKEIILPTNDDQNKETIIGADEDVKIEIVTKQNGYHHETEISNDEDIDAKDIFKGSYSEREKEKWSNAVEMKNNPYSSENLKQRLSNRSSSSVSSIFSKDNYVREAAKSTGTKDSPDSTLVEDPSPLHVNHIYTALPAFVESDNLPQTEASSFGTSSPIPFNDMSSDSDLSVERIYNLPTGNVYVNGKSNRSSIVNNINQVPSVHKTDEESIEKCMDFSLEFSTDESLQNNTKHESNPVPADPEITNLCDKHLVKDLLGQFSKSYPNLAMQSTKDVDCVNYNNETPPSVKCDTSKQVYSLTARSIPREFREELKKKEETPRCSSTSAILDEVQFEEATPFPVAKSKIKFFESLK